MRTSNLKRANSAVWYSFLSLKSKIIVMKDKKQTQDANKEKGKTTNPNSPNSEDAKANNDGSISRGNLVNSGKPRSTTELHTKKSVTGSDSDGQAE
jgi:hypothetical protein